MIIPGLPFDIPVKPLLIAGGVTVLVVSLLAALWLAKQSGKGEMQRKILAESAEALAVAKPKQEKREAAHAKRIEAIISSGLSPADVARMLSTYPPESRARAAREKAGGSH